MRKIAVVLSKTAMEDNLFLLDAVNSLAKHNYAFDITVFADEMPEAENKLPVTIVKGVVVPLAKNLLRAKRFEGAIKKFGANVAITSDPEFNAPAKVPTIYYGSTFSGNKSFSKAISFFPHSLADACVYHALPPLQSLSFAQQEKVKETYTNGHDYFCFLLDNNTAPYAMSVLKAFSIFKKWQKSSMKLVVIEDHAQLSQTVAKLHLYKYREDIAVIDLKDADRLISSCFAGIYLSKKSMNDFALKVAFHHPLIVMQDSTAAFAMNEAALLTTGTEDDLAECMMALYKHEDIGKQLSLHANLLVPLYTEKHSAALLSTVLSEV